MTSTAPAAKPRISRVFAALTLGRVMEQGLLGLAMLLLAARLGVRDFAPVSVLFIVNSLSATLADHGLAYSVLRLPPGTTINRRQLRTVRRTNAAIAFVLVAVGVALGGTTGVVVTSGGVMWALSAEGYIRKSAATREGRARDAALAECASSAVFFTIVAAAAMGERAAVVTVAAFVAKHAIEIVAVPGWRSAFAPDGIDARPGWIWLTQALSYAISNVDYLLVRLLCGVDAYSIYVVAFRVTYAPYAQVGTAIMRSSLIHLSTSDDLQRSYDRMVRLVFGAALAGSVVVGAGSTLAPVVLGDSWEPTVAVIMVLAISLPWRTVLSLGGTLAMRTDALRPLATWELLRLAATAVGLVGAGLVGFAAFVAAVSVVAILSALFTHRAAARTAGLAPWSALTPLALLAVAAALALSTRV